MLGAFLQWQHRLTFPGDGLKIDSRELVTGAADSLTGRLAP